MCVCRSWTESKCWNVPRGAMGQKRGKSGKRKFDKVDGMNKINTQERKCSECVLHLNRIQEKKESEKELNGNRKNRSKDEEELDDNPIGFLAPFPKKYSSYSRNGDVLEEGGRVILFCSGGSKYIYFFVLTLCGCSNQNKKNVFPSLVLELFILVLEETFFISHSLHYLHLVPLSSGWIHEPRMP